MNLHVITPSDLKTDAIERYSEMLENPRFKGQENFLKNEIKRLQNDTINFSDALCPGCNYHLNSDYHKIKKTV